MTVTWPDGTGSTVTADSSGTWSVESPTAQTSGTVTVAASDAAGNASTPATVSYADTAAPAAAIAIVAVSDDSGLAGDFITSDTELTVSGTVGALGAGEAVQLSIDGGLSWIDLTVSGGTWSYVDTRALADGTHVYEVRVVDAAGSTSKRPLVRASLSLQPQSRSSSGLVSHPVRAESG